MPTESGDIGEHLVSYLRGKFLAQISTTHEEYDDSDIDGIRTNDSILRRFLVAKNGGIEESLKMLVNAMKWRKSFDVNRLNAASFPREYYQMGGLFTYGYNLNGAQIIVFRVKNNKKLNPWTEMLKKFLVYLIEKESQRFANNQHKGICVVFDCKDAGIGNVDIDFLSFIVRTFTDYYPTLLESVVIHELPFLLKYVFQLVQSWLPKEHREYLHSVSAEDINQYIASEELPDFMGGTNPLSYRNCPKTAPTIQELALQMGISQKDVDKLLKHIQPFIQ